MVIAFVLAGLFNLWSFWQASSAQMEDALVQQARLAARAFGAGDLTARAAVGGSIRKLGDTFNQVAEEIAKREEKLESLDCLKSRFVSSVSHELRTPLTTINAARALRLRCRPRSK